MVPSPRLFVIWVANFLGPLNALPAGSAVPSRAKWRSRPSALDQPESSSLLFRSRALNSPVSSRSGEHSLMVTPIAAIILTNAGKSFQHRTEWIDLTPTSRPADGLSSTKLPTKRRRRGRNSLLECAAIEKLLLGIYCKPAAKGTGQSPHNHPHPAHPARTRAAIWNALKHARRAPDCWNSATTARPGSEPWRPPRTHQLSTSTGAPGVFSPVPARRRWSTNAAIFVNANDVLWSIPPNPPPPLAVAQIKRKSRPAVRYVVNSHFHWDHTQGNHAYRTSNRRSISSPATTKRCPTGSRARRPR